MINFYEILGVNEDASSEDIKSAYRKLAVQHHPDKGGSEDEFKKINEAYDTLKDDKKRQEYDYILHKRESSYSYHNEFHDIFSEFFHSRMFNEDTMLRAVISVEEAYHGTIKKYNDITLNIPRGAIHGLTIRVQGKGSQRYTHLPPGNLIIQIIIDTHPVYDIKGADLIRNIDVNCFLAIVGGKKEITTLSGEKLNISIPPKSKHGQLLRINGKGMPKLHQHNVYGDLYLKVNIYNPELTEEQQKLITKWSTLL